VGVPSSSMTKYELLVECFVASFEGLDELTRDEFSDPIARESHDRASSQLEPIKFNCV
jgi:hypothetical protein